MNMKLKTLLLAVCTLTATATVISMRLVKEQCEIEQIDDACALGYEMHTKKALEAVDGVTAAEVSHKTGTAVVTLAKDVADEVLRKAVADQGYEVTDIR